MSRSGKLVALLGSCLIISIVVLFTVLDYRSNFPYATWNGYFASPKHYISLRISLKQYLAFKKNIVKSYLYNFTHEITPPQVGNRVRFDIIDPKDPKAIEFLNQTSLSTELAGATSEFEKIIKIKEWVHSKVYPLLFASTPDKGDEFGFNPLRYKGDFSGFHILRGIQENALMGSGTATRLFLQIAGTVGIIGRAVIGYGHWMAEVWSKDHEKWIAIDPMLSAHFERNGVPLSFIELTNIFFPKAMPDLSYSQRTAAISPTYWNNINRAINSTEASEEVFQRAVESIRAQYKMKGITLVGGPRVLPKHVLAGQLQYLVCLTPQTFADFGVALRSDYIVHEYPIWHLRNQIHFWNFLWWSGSRVNIQPQGHFQVSANLKDFYFNPSDSE